MSIGKYFSIKKNLTFFVSIIALSLYGVFIVFAAAPNGGYAPGATLDPDCAPGDTDCIVAISGSGTPASPDTGIQYNIGGVFTADNLFTRDINHNTFIGKEIGTTATTATVVTSSVIVTGNISGTFVTGETITGGTSGATATIDNIIVQGNDLYLEILNLSGAFQSTETITGGTSGATAQFSTAFPFGQLTVSDTFYLYNISTQQLVGQGTITGTTVDGYTVQLSSGAISQYDLILDNLNNPTNIEAISSLNVSTGPGTPITSAFVTGDDIIPSLLPNIQGAGMLYHKDNLMSGFLAGNNYLGNDFTFSALAMDLTLNKGISMQAMYDVGNGTPLYGLYYLNPGGDSGEFRFDGSEARFGHENQINILTPNLHITTGTGATDGYYLPTTRGSLGQVLTDDGFGNVTWETVSGGSLPDQSGHGGEYLTTDGVTASWAVASGLLEGYTAGTMTALGVNATGGQQSAVFGNDAGNGATYNNYSTILGSSAGTSGNIDSSVLIGLWSGQGATAINYSVAIGYGVGSGVDVTYSNFIGATSGESATNAFNSNFFGYQAGAGATNAAHSIFIGDQAGYIDTVNNTVSGTSILIGDNTSTGGYSNSIAIGGSATNTSSNQFMIGSTTQPINTLVLTGASGNTCTLDVTVASPSCSSDERLKTNIEDLTTDTLDKVLNIRTVSYNWNNFPDKGKQIGFLAQDLEQYFPEIVSEAPNGFKTVSYGGMTPILVQAIREMNLKITDINNTETPNSWRDALIAWFGNTANGITDLFTKRIHTDELCVGTVCVTQDQFLQMVNNSGMTIHSGNSNPPVNPDPEINTDPNIDNDPGATDINTDTEANPDVSPTENVPVDSGDTPVE